MSDNLFVGWHDVLMAAYLVAAVVVIAGVIAIIRRRKGDWY